MAQGWYLQNVNKKQAMQGKLLVISTHSQVTCTKGHPHSADLRYGEEDIISPDMLMFATTKG